MIRMWGEIVEVGNGHVFVVLGAHVRRVLTPINGSHSNANLA
jgi:hypothetical protein